MTRFANTEAAERYSQKIWNLYMKLYRDPNNPDEYIGLDDKAKELRRCEIEEENIFLMKKIEASVEETRRGKPLKVCKYRKGEYRFSLIETIKARIRYYLNKSNVQF